jgi:hypothetical protein
MLIYSARFYRVQYTSNVPVFISSIPFYKLYFTDKISKLTVDWEMAFNVKKCTGKHFGSKNKQHPLLVERVVTGHLEGERHPRNSSEHAEIRTSSQGCPKNS